MKSWRKQSQKDNHKVRLSKISSSKQKQQAEEGFRPQINKPSLKYRHRYSPKTVYDQQKLIGKNSNLQDAFVKLVSKKINRQTGEELIKRRKKKAVKTIGLNHNLRDIEQKSTACQVQAVIVDDRQKKQQNTTFNSKLDRWVQKNMKKLNAIKTIYAPNSRSYVKKQEKDISRYLFQYSLITPGKQSNQPENRSPQIQNKDRLSDYSNKKFIYRSSKKKSFASQQYTVPRISNSVHQNYQIYDNQSNFEVREIMGEQKAAQTQNKLEQMSIEERKQGQFKQFKIESFVDMKFVNAGQNIVGIKRKIKKQIKYSEQSCPSVDISAVGLKNNSLAKKSSDDNISSDRSFEKSKQSNNMNNYRNEINDKKTDVQKPRQAYDKLTHYFSLDDKNDLLKQMLLGEGWKQTTTKSDNYTLKWSKNEEYKNYELLARNNNNLNNRTFPKKMYYNHIKRNLLVTKDGLHLIGSKIMESGRQISNFLPTTFNMNTQKAQLVQEYGRNALLILLGKYSRLFINQYHSCDNEQFNNGLQQSIDCLCSLHERASLKYQNQQNKQQSLVSFVQCYLMRKLTEQFNGQILVNIPVLFHLTIYCCNIWLCEQAGETGKFDRIYSPIYQNSSILAILIKYSKKDIQVKDGIQQVNACKQPIFKNKQSVKNKHKSQSVFATPSPFFIQTALKLFNYFKQKQQKKVLPGSNIWISKPCAGSKGKGIQIIDMPQKINQLLVSSHTMKIIQKYIQNVWILDHNQIDQLFIHPKNVSNSQGQQKTDYQTQKNALLSLFINHNLFGRKFDLRQWVLIYPPYSYIFSDFYLKICSDKYDLSKLDSRSSHLSNYSINKQAFSQGQQSVLSEFQFAELLKKLNQQQQYKKMKLNIHKNIQIIVEEGLQNCQWIQGTFELVGFDIVIDKNYNPWIIECNMSPACETRTPWLKQMRKASLEQTLSILLSQNQHKQSNNFGNNNDDKSCIQQKNKYRQKYYWKPLQTKFSIYKQNNKQILNNTLKSTIIKGNRIIERRKQH